MRDKKKSLMNVLKKECSRNVKVCTMKFCAKGCIDEEYDDEDIVCLKDSEVLYTDGTGRTEHVNKLCICDDNIIAFQVIKSLK